MHRFRFVLTLAAAALLFPSFAALAQSPDQSTANAETAPIPSAIPAAKTIFLSNAGADPALFPWSYSGLERNGPYSGTPRRGYDELYAALAASHRFQLVSDPSAADLVLEIRLISPCGVPFSSCVTPSRFGLTIYERPTHYILWTLDQSMRDANLQKTADRNFDAAIHSLAQQFLQLAGPAPATTP